MNPEMVKVNVDGGEFCSFGSEFARLAQLPIQMGCRCLLVLLSDDLKSCSSKVSVVEAGIVIDGCVITNYRGGQVRSGCQGKGPHCHGINLQKKDEI